MVRLRSNADPKIIIEGPVGVPFDPREWTPVGQSILEQNLKSVGRRTNAFSELGELARVGAPAAIQMGTTAAGSAIGAMTSPVTGPVGPVAGAMVGSGAGEAINQGLGLSEPDPGAIALAAALPGAMAGAGKLAEPVIKFGARHLPGAARTMHTMARESLEHLATIFGPKQTSGELYALVNTHDPKVPLTGFKKVAQALLSKEDIAGAALKLPGVSGAAADLAGRVTPTTKQVATGVLDARGKPIMRTVTEGSEAMGFQDIRINLSRIGDKIRETRISGGQEHGAWKSMRKALMEDLEIAAAQGNEAMPAVHALRQANAAFRRESVQEEIADIFTKGGMVSRNDIGEGFLQVNLNKIAELIRKGPHADDIKSLLRPEEFARLTSTVAQLAKATPNLPPPRGQFAGSAIKVGQVGFGTGAGTLAASAFGLNPVAGGAAGAVLATKGVDYLSRLVMSDRGSKVLQMVLQASPGGIISPQTMQLLGAAASQEPHVREGAVTFADFAQKIGAP